MSGTAATTGDKRTSGVESACRNLLSGCDLLSGCSLLSTCNLPTVEDALPTFDEALPTFVEALPTLGEALPTLDEALPMAEEGRPTAEEGGEGTKGRRGLLAWSPFAWKKTAAFFWGCFCGGSGSLGDLTLFAWKKVGEAYLGWLFSGGEWWYMLDSGRRGVGVRLWVFVLVPTVLRGRWPVGVNAGPL